MQQLLRYGFTQQDIDNLTYVYTSFGKVTSQLLRQLGCDERTVKRLMYAYNLYIGRIQIDSISSMVKFYKIVFDMPDDLARKKAYESDLFSGNVQSKEGLVTHLKKINRSDYKITMDDLAISSIDEVPQAAIVENISQKPYTIWNSNQYKGLNSIYRVTKATTDSIQIVTPRKPQLSKVSVNEEDIVKMVSRLSKGRFNLDDCDRSKKLVSMYVNAMHHSQTKEFEDQILKQALHEKSTGIESGPAQDNLNRAKAIHAAIPTIIKEKNDAEQKRVKATNIFDIPGVLHIEEGLTTKNEAIVTFSRAYSRLCNRFIIAASLTAPKMHIGRYEIICFEGTKVYVYAMNIGTRKKITATGVRSRVYDWGILPEDVKPKLTSWACKLYKTINGMSVEYNEPMEKYEYIPIDKLDTDEEDDAIQW